MRTGRVDFDTRTHIAVRAAAFVGPQTLVPKRLHLPVSSSRSLRFAAQEVRGVKPSVCDLNFGKDAAHQ